MRRLSLSLACVLPILLSACSTRSPAPAPQRLQVEGSWSGAQAASPAADTPGLWWKRWNDPQLDTLVAQAFEQNLDAAVAAARVAQARAAEGVARSARLPSLTVNTRAERRATPRIQREQANEAGFDLKGVRNQLNLDTQLAYEIDWLGRNDIAAQSAEAQTAAAQYDAATARVALAAAVVEAYADIAIAERRIELANARALKTAEAEAAEQRRISAGLSTRRVLIVRQDATARATESAAEGARERKQAIDRLALLMGQPAHRFAPPMANKDLLQQPLALQADEPADAIGRRPDVQAAWQRLQAAKSEAERARLERYPRISLTAGAGLVSESLRRWLRRDALGWVLGVGGSFPLFDGGRLDALADQAQAAGQERETEYRRTVLTALQEVESALAQFEFSARIAQQAAALTERRQTDEQSVRRELAAGRVARLALTDSERATLEAQDELARAQRAHLQSYVLLRRVLADAV